MEYVIEVFYLQNVLLNDHVIIGRDPQSNPVLYFTQGFIRIVFLEYVLVE